MHLLWFLSIGYVGVTESKYTIAYEILKDTLEFSLGGFMKIWSSELVFFKLFIIWLQLYMKIKSIFQIQKQNRPFL